MIAFTFGYSLFLVFNIGIVIINLLLIYGYPGQPISIIFEMIIMFILFYLCIVIMISLVPEKSFKKIYCCCSKQDEEFE